MSRRSDKRQKIGDLLAFFAVYKRLRAAFALLHGEPATAHEIEQFGRFLVVGRD
jgi:hypothetical protein